VPDAPNQNPVVLNAPSVSGAGDSTWADVERNGASPGSVCQPLGGIVVNIEPLQQVGIVNSHVSLLEKLLGTKGV